MSCKQRLIVHHLLSHGGSDIVAKYAQASQDSCGSNITEDAPIWICWWQGQEAMPDIVRACYNSVVMQAGSHPVVLITEQNYQEYVVLPAYIQRKLKEGIITLTHLSDILRVGLLRTHGGIWIDSTVLLPSRSISDFIHPTDKFWTCHHHPIYHNISKGGWTGFFWACGKGNILPAFMWDFFLKYWQEHGRLIEYLLIDYVFAIGRARVPAIHRMIEEVPISAMGRMGKCLNEPYTEERWEEFCTVYDFHKLTYKIPLHLRTPEGDKTFYGHIIETYLRPQ